MEATQTPNPDALKLLVLEDRPLLPKHMVSHRPVQREMEVKV